MSKPYKEHLKDFKIVFADGNEKTLEANSMLEILAFIEYLQRIEIIKPVEIISISVTNNLQDNNK